MFAERQYWQDVADRFVKENVTVKPNRGNIISSDGKLMASSLPEYRIYMDFMSGEKDEKRRRKDQARRDSILNANMDSICIGLHKIFPDKSAAQFKAHLKKGRQAKSRNYLIYPKRISYIQYKEVKRLPVFCLNRYKGGFKELAYNQRKETFRFTGCPYAGRCVCRYSQRSQKWYRTCFRHYPERTGRTDAPPKSDEQIPEHCRCAAG